MVLIVYCNDLPAPPYETVFDLAAPSFPPSREVWWRPRVVTLFDRYVHDQPICPRLPLGSIRFFAPVPNPTNPLTKKEGPPAGLDPVLYQAMTAGRLNPFLGASVRGYTAPVNP